MNQGSSGGAPKKVISLILDEVEVVELQRILTDKDAEGALAFLGAHLRGKAREALEGR
jgi:hypothetical protein